MPIELHFFQRTFLMMFYESLSCTNRTNLQYGKVMQMVKHGRLCGRAIVAYLQSKDFPEVALHFVREPKTRFRLALACGNIDAAIECALTLEQQSSSDGSGDVNHREIWGQLGSEALRQGNHQVRSCSCS